MRRVVLIIPLLAIFFGCNNNHKEESTPELKGLPFFLGQTISCVCRDTDPQSKILYLGTENGKIHTFDTETGLFAQMEYEFDNAVYQVLITKQDTLFAVRDRGLIDSKGFTYHIDGDKQTAYSAYSTKICGDSLVSATSCGLFAFRPGIEAYHNRLDTLEYGSVETDKLRFYSVLCYEGRMYAASETGLWSKDKGSLKAKKVNDSAPCQFIDSLDNGHAIILFSDGHWNTFDTRSNTIDEKAHHGLFSKEIRTIYHIPGNEGIVGVGAGLVETYDYDKDNRISNKIRYITPRRFDKRRHIAAIVDDYIYIASSVYLYRLAFDQGEGNAQEAVQFMYKTGSSIVSLALDYSSNGDSNSCLALTDKGDVYFLTSKQTKQTKLKKEFLGILDGYEVGDKLIGRLRDEGIYVQKGSKVLLYNKQNRRHYKSTPVLDSIRCVAPFNETSLIVGTTDTIYLYSRNGSSDSIKVPKPRDLMPEFIRVSGKSSKVFVQTLNDGAFLLYRDRVRSLDSLNAYTRKAITDMVFKDEDEAFVLYQVDNGQRVVRWRLSEDKMTDSSFFFFPKGYTPIRRIAFNLQQIIGIPDGFDLRGGAISVNQKNEPSVLVPGAYAYSMVSIPKGTIIGCDGFFMFIDYNESGRGQLDDSIVDRSDPNTPQPVWFVVFVVVGVFLIFSLIKLMRKNKDLSTKNKELEQHNRDLSTKVVDQQSDDYKQFLSQKEDRKDYDDIIESFLKADPHGKFVDELKRRIKTFCKDSNDLKKVINDIQELQKRTSIFDAINDIDSYLTNIHEKVYKGVDKDKFKGEKKKKKIEETIDKNEKEKFRKKAEYCYNLLTIEEREEAKKYMVIKTKADFGHLLLLSFVRNDTIDEYIARALGSRYSNEVFNLRTKVKEYSKHKGKKSILLCMFAEIAKSV